MTPTLCSAHAPRCSPSGVRGLRIATNVTQMALCHLVFAKPPAQCLAEPRFFTMFTGPTLAYNAAQLPPEVVQEDLRDWGEQIKAYPRLKFSPRCRW